MKKLALQAAAVAAVGAFVLPGAASAALTINGAGTGLGFSLTTFASGLPSPCCGYGAWGSATLSSGNVVMNGYNGSGGFVNYVWKDVDGQNPGSALSVKPWNDGNYASALGRVGSVVYGTHYSDNTTRVVNLDGSEGVVISNVGRGGLGADSIRNSLLVATDAGIQEIDLTNSNPNTNHRIVTGNYADGVTVSADGLTVYGEIGEHILGFSIASGVQTYDSGFIGSPDGVGVILSGVLAGDLIVNDNGGVLNLLNPFAHTITTIASGGSRGDYVGFDSSNGTLFLSQSDSLLRLTLAGGKIGGGGGGGVPEPATWAMMLIGFGGLGATLRRRRARAALAVA